GEAADVEVRPRDLARLGRLDPGQHVEERGLARTRRPRDAHARAGGQREPGQVEDVPTPSAGHRVCETYVVRVKRRAHRRYSGRAVASTRRTWLRKPVAESSFAPSSRTPLTSTGADPERYTTDPEPG